MCVVVENCECSGIVKDEGVEGMLMRWSNREGVQECMW